MIISLRLAAVLLAVALLVVIALASCRPVERFSLTGLVGNIKDKTTSAAKKVKDAAVTAVKKAPAVIKKVRDKAPGAAKTVKDKTVAGAKAVKVVGAGLLGGAAVGAAVVGGPAPVPQPAPPAPQAAAVATYVARQWDGTEWACPENTVDTGAADNAQACISSATVPRAADGSCPAGTVPDDGNACAVGWTTRVQDDSGAWVCPAGTSDTGTTWTTAPGAAGYRQCRLTKPYTLRVAQKGKWVCPPGTRDTGRTWGVMGGENQCKWGAAAAPA